MATESKAAQAARAARYRRQIADHQSAIQGLEAKLAAMEAKQAGQPKPVTEIDQLWEIALEAAQNRSSKQLCRIAWNRIPKSQRPTIQEAVEALKVWNRSREWKANGNQYVPALDKWIKARRWESLPEVPKASARYVTIQKSLPETTPEEAATPEEIKALLNLRVRS